jgi:cytochrome oxidase assembly protein ShyY1
VVSIGAMKPDGEAQSTGRDVATTRPSQFGGLAIPVPTAATYDTVTEGRTGWRFVLTRRWVAFFLGVIVYAAGCVAGVIWQADLGAQIAQFNATVSRNFNSPPVPLNRVLATPGSYRASIQWKPVTATGSYLVAEQLYVRNRTCGSDTGFEVLTPFRISGGRAAGSDLIIDRGCVDASAANPDDPVSVALPPSGRVSLTARVVAGEAAKGAVVASQADERAADQIDSIDLPQISRRLKSSTYTGAYGMLISEAPAPSHPLHRVLTHKPSVDASVQQGTIFATVLYALVGLGIFGFALREKFRFVNRFDPRLWAKEWKRIQRLARKPYTDAEIEDLLIDGYPFSRIPAIEAATKGEASGGEIAH